MLVRCRRVGPVFWAAKQHEQIGVKALCRGLRAAKWRWDCGYTRGSELRKGQGFRGQAIAMSFIVITVTITMIVTWLLKPFSGCCCGICKEIPLSSIAIVGADAWSRCP